MACLACQDIVHRRCWGKRSLWCTIQLGVFGMATAEVGNNGIIARLHLHNPSFTSTSSRTMDPALIACVATRRSRDQGQGGQLSENERRGENFEFQQPLQLTPFYKGSIEILNLAVKSPSFRGANFGRSPPLSAQYVFTPWPNVGTSLKDTSSKLPMSLHTIAFVVGYAEASPARRPDFLVSTLEWKSFERGT